MCTWDKFWMHVPPTWKAVLWLLLIACSVAAFRVFLYTIEGTP